MDIKISGIVISYLDITMPPREFDTLQCYAWTITFKEKLPNDMLLQLRRTLLRVLRAVHKYSKYFRISAEYNKRNVIHYHGYSTFASKIDKHRFMESIFKFGTNHYFKKIKSLPKYQEYMEKDTDVVNEIIKDYDFRFPINTHKHKKYFKVIKDFTYPTVELDMKIVPGHWDLEYYKLQNVGNILQILDRDIL